MTQASAQPVPADPAAGRPRLPVTRFISLEAERPLPHRNLAGGPGGGPPVVPWGSPVGCLPPAPKAVHSQESQGDKEDPPHTQEGPRCWGDLGFPASLSFSVSLSSVASILPAALLQVPVSDALRQDRTGQDRTVPSLAAPPATCSLLSVTGPWLWGPPWPHSVARSGVGGGRFRCPGLSRAWAGS